MKRTIAIAALSLSNVGLALFAAYYYAKPREAIFADHVQASRVDAAGGEMHITLGQSATPSGAVVQDPERSGTIILTPRAAIQLHSALGQTIRAVQEAADLQAQRAEPRSPDLTL